LGVAAPATIPARAASCISRMAKESAAAAALVAAGGDGGAAAIARFVETRAEGGAQ